MRAFFVMGLARPSAGFDEPEPTEGGPDRLGEGGLSRMKMRGTFSGKVRALISLLGFGAGRYSVGKLGRLMISLIRVIAAAMPPMVNTTLSREATELPSSSTS